MALSLFLISVGISSLQIARAETTYPFKTVFEQDLSAISRHTPHIEEIQVIQVFNMERSVAIRIGYSQGLSDPTKIALQDEVQEALQQKSYVESIGKNYISCIPEDKSCPPWPGFVIGDLMVMFIDVPTDPLIHPWPNGSTLVASNIGSTSLTLTWSNTRDGSHTVAYRLSDSYSSEESGRGTHDDVEPDPSAFPEKLVHLHTRNFNVGHRSGVPPQKALVSPNLIMHNLV